MSQQDDSTGLPPVPRFALCWSAGDSPRPQPPRILLVLIVDRSHLAYRSTSERADLFRPASLPLDQEINDASLAHHDARR
jgi:hypothetical protein